MGVCVLGDAGTPMTDRLGAAWPRMDTRWTGPRVTGSGTRIVSCFLTLLAWFSSALFGVVLSPSWLTSLADLLMHRSRLWMASQASFPMWSLHVEKRLLGTCSPLLETPGS